MLSVAIIPIVLNVIMLSGKAPRIVQGHAIPLWKLSMSIAGNLQRCHDTEHNGIQPNGTDHQGIQQNNK